MSFSPPATPAKRRISKRHSLLFELIRQRDMAKFINDRVSRHPSSDPSDLGELARNAERSLGVAPKSRLPTL